MDGQYPDGAIEVWGSVTTTGVGAAAATFVSAFPNQVYQMVLGLVSNSPISASCTYSGLSKTGANIFTNDTGGSVQLPVVSYRTIGR